VGRSDGGRESHSALRLAAEGRERKGNLLSFGRQHENCP
jgi:hypothetical protein